MIAVDWSHTKDLATYDGKKSRTETAKALLKRLEGESNIGIESRNTLQLAIVIEQGCPLALIYGFVKSGHTVGLIDNHATEAYRKEFNIEKTDENDAKIIYKLANDGAKLQTIDVSDKMMETHSLYHQYCCYQKARVAMTLMKKAHERSYGDGKSTDTIKSTEKSQPNPYDLSPYDTAIESLQSREKSLLKQLDKSGKEPIMEGGESKRGIQSIIVLNPPSIKGLGKRIWIGLMVTANPVSFRNLSGYLRYCGLTSDVVESHKYNRHAKMLYHLLSEEILKQKDPEFRPIYDKCKADITEKHSDYTKLHIHNAALNRTATFLAKRIFKHCKSIMVDS